LDAIVAKASSTICLKQVAIALREHGDARNPSSGLHRHEMVALQGLARELADPHV